MDEGKISSTGWCKLALNCFRVIIVSSSIAGIICGTQALSSAIVSDDEYRDYYDSLMERDTYLKWRQIGQEYGVFTEHYYYWKYIEPSQEMVDKVKETINSFSGHKNLFLKAISKNFDVPVDPKRDKEIMNSYERLQIKKDYLERKMVPRNRFIDTMAWIGGMSLLFLIVYISYKALMYLSGERVRLKGL